MNKYYQWFNITGASIGGFPLWLSAKGQKSASDTLQVMRRVVDSGITSAKFSHVSSEGVKLRSFDLILN